MDLKIFIKRCLSKYLRVIYLLFGWASSTDGDITHFVIFLPSLTNMQNIILRSKLGFFHVAWKLMCRPFFPHTIFYYKAGNTGHYGAARERVSLHQIDK